MIILIDTEEKIIEVDHTSPKIFTFNTLAELLMEFNNYDHVSLKQTDKPIIFFNITEKDIKPGEPNIKKL